MVSMVCKKLANSSLSILLTQKILPLAFHHISTAKRSQASRTGRYYKPVSCCNIIFCLWAILASELLNLILRIGRQPFMRASESLSTSLSQNSLLYP